MSLILEALRKSEAERRAGQPQDPFATPAPEPLASRARSRRGAWIVGAGALAVVLLAVLAWAFRGVGDERSASQDDAVATANSTQGVDATAPSDAEVPAPDVDRFPAIERIAPPAADAGARVATDDAAPANTPATTPEVAPPAATTPPVPTPAAGPATSSAPPADPARVPPASPPPSPDPSPTTDVASSTTRAPTTSGTPLRLSELPPAQRDRLPALRVSMHMWNADPARRFVIVDGHRQVEGDRIGAGVLRAIDEDGMLVEIDGRSVRVPLP